MLKKATETKPMERSALSEDDLDLVVGGRILDGQLWDFVDDDVNGPTATHRGATSPNAGSGDIDGFIAGDIRI